MSPRERQRLGVLGGLLLATLALAAVSSGDDENAGVVLPVVRSSGPTAQTAAEESTTDIPRLSLAVVQREASEPIATDIFAPHSWVVQPPPPPPSKPVATKPPAPTVPPLPFAYAGQLSEIGGRLVVYLTLADRVLVVAAGDVIEERYRLDSIEEAQLTFTYLPLNTKQFLPVPRR